MKKAVAGILGAISILTIWEAGLQKDVYYGIAGLVIAGAILIWNTPLSKTILIILSGTLLSIYAQGYTVKCTQASTSLGMPIPECYKGWPLRHSNYDETKWPLAAQGLNGIIYAGALGSAYYLIKKYKK